MSFWVWVPNSGWSFLVLTICLQISYVLQAESPYLYRYLDKWLCLKLHSVAWREDRNQHITSMPKQKTKFYMLIQGPLPRAWRENMGPSGTRFTQEPGPASHLGNSAELTLLVMVQEICPLEHKCERASRLLICHSMWVAEWCPPCPLSLTTYSTQEKRPCTSPGHHSSANPISWGRRWTCRGHEWKSWLFVHCLSCGCEREEKMPSPIASWMREPTLPLTRWRTRNNGTSPGQHISTAPLMEM